ncbi:YhcN/YlaJ family sporulation lipoprotein [Ammoniphilus sp. CFH 90114]|uniref:YhcN/YlaJ family sporulation lipoprotein n=1 Tax=Ammoniphilus sp. CFH 90114 TaxID=2493665 RepID=UPI0013E95F39|nr:YhcN/YlaJ family sporulation lipoprotein [Ammoniphilus sp. CFH 90114]
MPRIVYVFLSVIMAASIAGCGKDKEQAKGGDEKKAKTQNEQQAQTTVRGAGEERVRTFNHSASLKMQEMIEEVPEVSEPVIVVFGKEALMGYKVKPNVDPLEAQMKLEQKMKEQMPNYRLQASSDPEWYERVAILHRDSIESEGKTIKNLEKDFKMLRDRK